MCRKVTANFSEGDPAGNFLKIVKILLENNIAIRYLVLLYFNR